MRKQILDAYLEAVAFSSAPDELKKSLKTNERVPAFLTNLETELKKIPGGARADQIKLIVYDLTKVFLWALEKKANERMLSDAEKTRMQREQDKIDRFKEAAETGIISEEVLSE